MSLFAAPSEWQVNVYFDLKTKQIYSDNQEETILYLQIILTID